MNGGAANLQAKSLLLWYKGEVGWQEGHPACKKTGCWFVGSDDL